MDEIKKEVYDKMPVEFLSESRIYKENLKSSISRPKYKEIIKELEMEEKIEKIFKGKNKGRTFLRKKVNDTITKEETQNGITNGNQ